MSFPKIVRKSPVRHGDAMALTVSTMQLGPNYYDTVIFDDSDDKRHDGWVIGGFVINRSSKRADTREAAMDQHREALHAARTEEPTQPATELYGDVSRLARIVQLVEDARDKGNAFIDTDVLVDALGLDS